MLQHHISWKNRKLDLPHFLHVSPFVPNSEKCYLQNAECDWGQHQPCWDAAKFRERPWMSSSSQPGAHYQQNSGDLDSGQGLSHLKGNKENSRLIPFNDGVAEQNWVGWAGRREKGLELLLKGKKELDFMDSSPKFQFFSHNLTNWSWGQDSPATLRN